VYRVPRKESVVRPRSRCPSCGHELTAIENIPVVSWLIQGGKCRNCKAPVSPRYIVGEIATAALWVAAVYRFPHSAALVIVYAALFWVLLALSLIDLEHKLLPNAVVYPATVVGLAGFAIAGAVLHHMNWWIWGLIGGGASFLFFFVIALISPAGMGMGDVKLSFLLGFSLAFLGGWRPVVAGFFTAFLAGAVVGLALMAAGKAGRKSAVPFGPFMALGAVVTILWTDAVLRILPNI
jgi:leader peptidase (prepilin peptidase)/N-methyltransferase